LRNRDFGCTGLHPVARQVVEELPLAASRIDALPGIDAPSSAKPQAAKRQKAPAFSYTPIVRDRDNNRARRIHKSSKPPTKTKRKNLRSAAIVVTPFARL
jgi:hypothetical protein